MGRSAILYPMIVLVLLTFIVLLIVPYRRFRAGKRGEVHPRDFLYGESAKVPGEVSIPNRNFMNLLELPVLFYVVCLALYMTRAVTIVDVYLAWLFVALRTGHIIVHLTYNRLLHRLSLHAAAAVVLFGMWISLSVALLSRGA